MRGEWSCVSMEDGEQFVMINGMQMMPQLSAINLATLAKVCYIRGLSTPPIKLHPFHTGLSFAVTRNDYFGPGDGFILLDDVACEGTEISLLGCRASELGVHNCRSVEDAAVICPSELVKLQKTLRTIGDFCKS